MSGSATVHAVKDVSFSIGEGELVAVMGPSGSGKSTLLGMAGGLDQPTAGDVYVEGHALASRTPAELARLRRQHIGYVFQDFNLVAGLTAAENVALPRELAGLRPRIARQEAASALQEVGLEELAGRFPHEMSGGQQQRVAIARALLGNRRLVLADEPTGALDTTTAATVMQVLRSRIDAGAAGLLVTHDEGLLAWADRVVRMRDGHASDLGKANAAAKGTAP
ncbi:ABC transporter ATP-binding protein [Salinispora cortesiana]|uniref:ABC transporter ATP-binding protein n=1 Tax=Salinispora cortesiana TaxID=1305843 RepID=UPI00046EB3DF|nr:ABC transporter ATP-binding protein [Salinispora cortesiana]